MPGWTQIVIGVYALLMLGGGIGGYASKGSVPSLISGIVSGVLLAVALALGRSNPKTGLGLSVVVAVVLAAFFVKRLSDTGKFMPSGGLLLLSLMVAAALGYALLRSKNGD